ncbi:hypothetical protein TorRG33x02_122000 [Trema orientale]|uniref:Uncharacterized protein n=1 Tax=Trema orientale TaxID=63057 RepID=A0A2P5F2X0_TREOI|nr:hypothetical protein TorRG33x02_122000 [Trema orientale]
MGSTFTSRTERRRNSTAPPFTPRLDLADIAIGTQGSTPSLILKACPSTLARYQTTLRVTDYAIDECAIISQYCSPYITRGLSNDQAIPIVLRMNHEDR